MVCRCNRWGHNLTSSPASGPSHVFTFSSTAPRGRQSRVLSRRIPFGASWGKRCRPAVAPTSGQAPPRPCRPIEVGRRAPWIMEACQHGHYPKGSCRVSGRARCARPSGERQRACRGVSGTCHRGRVPSFTIWSISTPSWTWRRNPLCGCTGGSWPSPGVFCTWSPPVAPATEGTSMTLRWLGMPSSAC